MTDELTQAEADRLIAAPKRAEEREPVWLPELGGKVSVPLVSVDGRDRFALDVRRGRIDLSKGTNQLRGRQTVILVRLDYGGKPHRNPDGEEIGSPHLHLYREGYADKWAFPIPPGVFSNIDDHWATLQEFLTYCQVIERPEFRRGLFT